jgi:hypothetical protein
VDSAAVVVVGSDPPDQPFTDYCRRELIDLQIVKRQGPGNTWSS